MTSVEFTSRQAGPITLHIDTQAADIQAVSNPSITGAWIEVSTDATSGPAAEAVRSADFRDNGNTLRLNLREGQAGGTAIQTGGSMVMVNGRVIGGGGSFSSSRITVRAMLEPGSHLVAKTMSGDVETKGVSSVSANTMSGDIEADGVTADSQLKTMSGDIRVYGARPGAQDVARRAGLPRVSASSMSGDVTGDGVDLDGSSMSGRVRQR